MSSQNFRLKRFRSTDKTLTIMGNDITILIDFDDVDTKETLKLVSKVLTVLENYWDKEE